MGQVVTLDAMHPRKHDEVEAHSHLITIVRYGDEPTSNRWNCSPENAGHHPFTRNIRRFNPPAAVVVQESREDDISGMVLEMTSQNFPPGTDHSLPLCPQTFSQRPTPHIHTILATTVAIDEATRRASGIIVPSIAMLVRVANIPPAGVNPPYMYDWKAAAKVPRVSERMFSKYMLKSRFVPAGEDIALAPTPIGPKPKAKMMNATTVNVTAHATIAAMMSFR